MLTIGGTRPTGGQGGTVSFAYSGLQSGSHTITAVYSGDANFVGSTSNALAVAVNKAAPTITPTGSIQFFDGATSLGTVTVNGSGSASLTLTGATALAAGSHSITAVYNGDSNFSTVTSSALSYVVSKVNATIAATSSLNPSKYGDSVTFSIQLSSSAGAVPTGTVLVKDGGTTLGTATLNGTGAATLTVLHVFG